MSRWKIGFAAVAVLAVASMSSAATLTLTPTVQATYDAAGVNLGNSFIPGAGNIYRMAIMAKVDGLAANQSFGLVGYDVKLDTLPGLSRNSVSVGGATTGLTNVKPNYVADSPATALFVSATGSPLTNWYTGGQNGDLGSVGTDLVGMLTAVDSANLDGLEDVDGTHQPDPRLGIGTGAAPGTRLGVIYVKWDGTIGSTFTLTSALWSTASSVTHQFSDTAPAIVVPYVFVPEPSTIVLASMAGIGLVIAARRRRTA